MIRAVLEALLFPAARRRRYQWLAYGRDFYRSKEWREVRMQALRRHGNDPVMPCTLAGILDRIAYQLRPTPAPPTYWQHVREAWFSLINAIRYGPLGL